MAASASRSAAEKSLCFVMSSVVTCDATRNKGRRSRQRGSRGAAWPPRDSTGRREGGKFWLREISGLEPRSHKSASPRTHNITTVECNVGSQEALDRRPRLAYTCAYASWSAGTSPHYYRLRAAAWVDEGLTTPIRSNKGRGYRGLLFGGVPTEASRRRGRTERDDHAEPMCSDHRYDAA
jgi:hypothetical protein